MEIAFLVNILIATFGEFMWLKIFKKTYDGFYLLNKVF